MLNSLSLPRDDKLESWPARRAKSAETRLHGDGAESGLDERHHSTAEGWLYLAVIFDLFNRQVLSRSMQLHIKAELVTDALRTAWFRRRPEAGVIVPSDRGSQYCSGLFRFSPSSSPASWRLTARLAALKPA